MTIVLTEIEHQILVDMSNGMSTKESAAKYHVQRNKVEGIRHDIFVKLQARNSPHAVAIAIRNGTLPYI